MGTQFQEPRHFSQSYRLFENPNRAGMGIARKERENGKGKTGRKDCKDESSRKQEAERPKNCDLLKERKARKDLPRGTISTIVAIKEEP
ncbi:hypothetical protein FF011L_15720 [Roseimaritima multifibrata]|uniref:Uncharacterized protein n=1 Tax=Roseimaritima multifibrata TaxID=1930274 RepID=A0A517MD56_9BACT|nr:hypothetical protein FF011L_15720 [Roseimaritima multifibrata]